jgi:hypothetical protein
MSIFKDEIFGPVIAVCEFSTLDEAIELANNSIYGLSSAIFTTNPANAKKYVDGIEAGLAHVASIPGTRNVDASSVASNSLAPAPETAKRDLNSSSTPLHSRLITPSLRNYLAFDSFPDRRYRENLPYETTTYEATVENGQIKLWRVRLLNIRRLVVVPDVEVTSSRISSPLAHRNKYLTS